MGVVVRFDGIKLKINAKDHRPPHVHAEGYGEAVRINLLTLEQMDDTGFNKATVQRIIEEVGANRDLLLDAWEMYHGKE